jgi:ferrochelatase
VTFQAVTKPTLVVLNLGTPTAPTEAAVAEFLEEFLSDPTVVDLPAWLWRPILRGIVLKRRPRRVAHQYQSIWTPAGSPLRVATTKIVDGLRAIADGRFDVEAAYRYGEPSATTVMTRLAAGFADPIITVPLFPHRTEATTGTAIAAAAEAAKKAGIEGRVRSRLIAPNDPGYIAALAARWNETIGQGAPPEHLLISFHGLPVRYDRREGYTYTTDCNATYRALLTAIGWPADRATLAYQSKFGPEPWLRPATATLLAELPGRGVRRVAVMAPGFLTEGLETLEEIAIRGRETFVEAGGESFLYVPAVEAHPALLGSIARLAGPEAGPNRRP